MRHVLFVIFSLLYFCSHGQDGELVKTRFEVHLEGKIANKFQIEMNLTATNSTNERQYIYPDKHEPSFQVAGYYLYKSKHIEIPIIGNICLKEDETIDVNLYEFDSLYTKKAIFKGKSNTNNLKTITGTWQNIQKGNLLNFSLNLTSKTFFTFEEQIFLNHNLWDLNFIFGNEVILADKLSVIEKQENTHFVAYLIHLQFYSNPNVGGRCGGDPSDEKLVWIKFDKVSNEILKKQLFDLTICRGNTSNDFEADFKKNWTKISINITNNEYDKKKITNISINKDKFWDGFVVRDMK